MSAGPDDSVLGNLPRSRPGRRSAKRGARGASVRKPAGAAPETGSAPDATPEKAPVPEAAQADLLDLMVRGAHAWAGLAFLGPRIALELTSAILRRLPGPFRW